MAALIWIWFVPLKRLLSTAAAIALCLLGASPARAYYDKTDYTEAVTIYPNETAFWIPDNGGNKDSQGQLASADYYNSNRVALKRFIVPHTQLSGSGWGPWGNYFTPAGRLILVDRTPYNRRHIADKDQQIAALLAPYAVTIQTLAAADALRAFGLKTDGKLPSAIVGLPSNVAGLLQGLLSPAAPVTNHP